MANLESYTKDTIHRYIYSISVCEHDWLLMVGYEWMENIFLFLCFRNICSEIQPSNNLLKRLNLRYERMLTIIR